MAIIKGTYVTRLSGKVGDVVYRMRDGQNIASQKASVVKNPRTDAQQTQRMIMATVSAAYAAMKAICDHSFEGTTYGSRTMGEFMRRNLAIMKAQNKSFNAKGNSYMLPNPLIVSRGSLAPVSLESCVGTQDQIAIRTTYMVEGDPATMTVEQFHNLLGIEIGDQITVIGLNCNTDMIVYDSGDVQQYQTFFNYARMVFKPASAAAKLLTEGALNTEALDLDASENYNSILFDSLAADLELMFGLRVPGSKNNGGKGAAGAVIISRKNGSNWLRSTQSLVVEDTGRDTKENILPTYTPTGNKYLNNAIV